MTQTQEKSLATQIKEERDKLANIHGTMALHMNKAHPQKTIAKVQELQDRLEFRVANYELQLLKEKTDIYGQVLDIIKKTP